MASDAGLRYFQPDVSLFINRVLCTAMTAAVCFVFTLAPAAASATFHQVLMTLVKHDLLAERLHKDGQLGQRFCEALGGDSCYLVSSLGEGVCRSSGGESCYLVSSLAEGICRAGRGDSCYLVSGIGEGICKGGGGDSCYLVSSVGEGICKASCSPSCYLVSSVEEGLSKYKRNFCDKAWDWDEFYDARGRSVWACRGVQTGRFSEEEKCWYKSKNDRRWPGG
jgi:uncharacterized membrane protein